MIHFIYIILRVLTVLVSLAAIVAVFFALWNDRPDWALLILAVGWGILSEVQGK